MADDVTGRCMVVQKLMVAKRVDVMVGSSARQLETHKDEMFEGKWESEGGRERSECFPVASGKLSQAVA